MRNGFNRGYASFEKQYIAGPIDRSVFSNLLVDQHVCIGLVADLHKLGKQALFVERSQH